MIGFWDFFWPQVCTVRGFFRAGHTKVRFQKVRFQKVRWFYGLPEGCNRFLVPDICEPPKGPPPPHPYWPVTRWGTLATSRFPIV